MGLPLVAVVPVKHFAGAKSRMGLPAAERADLAARMAAITLQALVDARQVARIIVITADQEAAALARTHGAMVVDEPGGGLNPACRAGLAAAGQAPVLLVHADFLHLTGADIDHLAAQWQGAAIGLLGCKDGDGTNAVLIPPGLRFTPRFGPGSFARHRADHPGAQILHSAALAQDIDSRDDLRLAGFQSAGY